MNTGRLCLAVVLLLAVVVVGCSGTEASPTRRPSTPRPTASPIPTFNISDILRNRGQQTLPTLLDGAKTPPFVLDWAGVESKLNLPTQQQRAFCATLDLPGLDDGLSALLYLGLNALSERITHRPLPEDTKTVLDYAVGFAVKTCPTWIPKVAPTRAPAADWFPARYQPVTGDADVVWDWEPVSCSAPAKRCWGILVLARTGCPTAMTVSIDVLDKQGTLVEPLSISGKAIPAMKAWKFTFGTRSAAATGARAKYVMCR